MIASKVLDPYLINTPTLRAPLQPRFQAAIRLQYHCSSTHPIAS
jgi:hypothetical protein